MRRCSSFGLLQLDAVLGSGATDWWFLVLALYGLGMAHPYGSGFHDLVAGTRVTTQADPNADAAADIDTAGEDADASTQTGGLRLPRPELVATPEDPFGQDKLNRQPHVKGLCQWLDGAAPGIPW